MPDIFDLADVWNNGGTVFTSIKMDVTDTASDAASLLMDLQKSSVSQFSVSKDGDVVMLGGLTLSGFVSTAAPTELTIATGAVTATKSYHTVDTEADAASDDLDTISGGVAGAMLVITAADSARSVVAKDGTGNLLLSGDFTMDNAEDTLTLLYNGSNWLELSRSDNGA